MRTKFDINLLNTFSQENSLEIIGDYEKLNRESFINGKCKTTECNGEFNKAFRTLLVNKSFFCDLCVIKNKCQKIKETNITNCGFTSNLKCPKTKEKIKQTNIEKYGYEFHLQNESIRKKRDDTFMKNYGGHPSKNIIIKNKIKATNLVKYGYEYTLQNEEIKNKIKATNLLKYGYEYTLQNEEIKNKIKETCVKKYGVKHCSQSTEIMEKISKNAYNSKEYIYPSGKIINIQGYENFALDFLLINENINESDIITGCKNVPTVWYNDENNKKHRHYVDIFIPSQNKCIEVKSTWTVEKKKDCIFLKQNAAKELGYNYEIWVYDKKGNIVNKYC
jgi:hypothetical protein